MTPKGPQPGLGQVRDDITGRPGAPVTRARMSGNGGPPMVAKPSPGIGGPAGSHLEHYLSMLAVLATGFLAAYGLTWLAVAAGLALSRGLAYVLAVGP